jgi:hypothetical protein
MPWHPLQVRRNTSLIGPAGSFTSGRCDLCCAAAGPTMTIPAIKIPNNANFI